MSDNGMKHKILSCISFIFKSYGSPYATILFVLCYSKNDPRYVATTLPVLFPTNEAMVIQILGDFSTSRLRLNFFWFYVT